MIRATLDGVVCRGAGALGDVDLVRAEDFSFDLNASFSNRKSWMTPAARLSAGIELLDAIDTQRVRRRRR